VAPGHAALAAAWSGLFGLADVVGLWLLIMKMVVDHRAGRRISHEQKRRLPGVYPFTSRPLTDLKAILLFLPLFWLFGLEQIVPPFLIAWAAVKLFFGRRELRLPLPAIPFFLFLIWQIMAQFGISEPTDWVVFGRNVIAYGSALLILLIVANDVRHVKEIHKFSHVIIGLSLVATLAGILFVIGLLPNQFQAPLVENVLPGVLRNSRFVQEAIILREIGRPDAVFGPFVYPRVSTLFLFPTGAGIGYVIFLFWQWYDLHLLRGLKHWLGWLLFGLSLLILVLTTARMAWLAFGVSVVTVGLFRQQFRARLPLMIAPIVLLVGLLGLALVTIVDDTLLNWLNLLFGEIRPGSIQDRLSVYVETFRLWAERPLLGWGSPMTVSSIALAPVGTHSELLGLLFRFGLVGFLCYLGIILSVWLQIGRVLQQAAALQNRTLLRLGTLIAAIFLAVNLMYFSYGFYFDFTVILLHWVTIGFIYSKPFD
jgi:hypothetical protein